MSDNPSRSSAAARKEIARGIALRDAGNLKAATDSFQTVIGLDAQDPQGFLLLADLQLRQQQYKQAIATAKSGLSLPCGSQNRSFGLRILAIAYINLKQRKRALAAAVDAVTNDPADAYNRRVYAQALWSARRMKLAEAEFQHALALSPAVLSTLTAYARFLKVTSRLRDAEKIVDRAVLIQPDAPEVILLRGQIAFRFGRLEEARDMALWALSVDAINHKALELLAMVKSRRSWLTMPFWLLSNLLSRHRRFTIAAIVVAGGFLGAAGGSLLVGTAVLNTDAAVGDVMILFLVYAVACGLHVSWLVRRDLRQVKLKTDF